MKDAPKGKTAGTASPFDEVAPVSESALASLLALATETLELEKEAEAIGELLKAKNSRLNILKTLTIPEAMAEVGLTEFKTPEGNQIKVDDFVAGSLPKDEAKRLKAVALLESIGGEALIKNQLTADFGKSQHNEALELRARLEQEGYEVVIKSDVHAGSLAAFVREKLRAGEECDYETLGLFVGRKAKITPPKAPKAKKEKAS